MGAWQRWPTPTVEWVLQRPEPGMHSSGRLGACAMGGRRQGLAQKGMRGD